MILVGAVAAFQTSESRPFALESELISYETEICVWDICWLISAS